MKALFLFFVFLTIAGSAAAHESRPLTIVIRETGEAQYILSAQPPASIDRRNIPVVKLGAPCIAKDRVREGVPYDCPGGLEGAPLTIDYPIYNPSVASLVRVVRLSGEVSTEVLGPDTRAWRAPAPETFAGVARSYFTLGVKHILSGFDHIAFLIGLLILARTPARVLVTITGFTLAHSLTLALVALDLVRVSVPAIEAAIALSIVFVAAEIARGDRTSLAWRRPILVASTFGLLHGAGFAAILSAIGLPQVEKIPALLFFNVGVEAGQVMLVAAAFAWFWSVMKAREMIRGETLQPVAVRAVTLAGYVLGIVAAYWFIGRLGALVA
jgi:hydrogenase/urease accessory protein HupE